MLLAVACTPLPAGAFVSDKGGNAEVIAVINADGSGEEQITSDKVRAIHPTSNVRLVANTEGRGIEPRWSIDGSKIFFTNCQHKDYGVDCHIMVAEVTR